MLIILCNLEAMLDTSLRVSVMSGGYRMTSDNKFTLILSRLSGTMTKDGVTIDICIYRGNAETTWSLEVADEGGVSTVWDISFETEQQAMDELNRTIAAEGMIIFAPDQGATKH